MYHYNSPSFKIKHLSFPKKAFQRKVFSTSRWKLYHNSQVTKFFNLRLWGLNQAKDHRAPRAKLFRLSMLSKAHVGPRIGIKRIKKFQWQGLSYRVGLKRVEWESLWVSISNHLISGRNAKSHWFSKFTTIFHIHRKNYKSRQNLIEFQYSTQIWKMLKKFQIARNWLENKINFSW